MPFEALGHKERIEHQQKGAVSCPADAEGAEMHSHLGSPSPLFPDQPLTRAWCGPVGTFSYTFCGFKQKHYSLPHPSQREGFGVLFHRILQSVLFCADAGGRILEGFLAKEQVCLSNKNKQIAKRAGEAGLKIAQRQRLAHFYLASSSQGGVIAITRWNLARKWIPLFQLP